MPTRTDLDNLIATNLADFSRIEPSEHRAVETAILDYIDQKIALTAASLGIFVKDNELIIPSSGSFVNVLDFDGATNSYLNVKREKYIPNSWARFEISPSLDLNIGTTMTLFPSEGLNIDRISIGASSPTGGNFFTVFFINPLPNAIYQVAFDFHAGTTAGNAQIQRHVINSKTINSVSIDLYEDSASIQSLFRLEFYAIDPTNGLINQNQEATGIDFSTGGTHSLIFGANEILKGIDLVITGGATPGVYRLI